MNKRKLKERTVYNPRWWFFLLVVIPLCSPLFVFLLLVAGAGWAGQQVDKFSEKVNEWVSIGPIDSAFMRIRKWVYEKTERSGNDV